MPRDAHDDGRYRLEFSVLGSGSSGNASLVRSSKTTVLIDAGMSCRQIRLRLESIGQDPAGLDAILLTHEHSDHTGGLRVLCNQYPGVPIYASAPTRRVIGEKLDCAVEWQIIPRDGSFALGELDVSTFPVPHDAVDPLGFVLRHGPTKLGIVTDAGHVTETMRRRLAGAHGLFVETNYDPGLLEADLRRPWGVKQRIMGQHGHLSNSQATELIGELLSAGLQRLVCGHLSSDCNTPEKVRDTVAAATAESSHSFDLYVSERDAPTPLLHITGDPDPEATPEPIEQKREPEHRVQGDLFGVL